MQAKVAVVMGSKSDWPTMQAAAEIMDKLQVPYEVEVVSAHRTPDKLMSFASNAADRGIQVIIGGAGGAAHLPGMIASKTRLPVLGVPVQSKALNGMDSLLSIAQMPKGVAVGTLAIGVAGAFNAGLLASQMLGNNDAKLAARIEAFRAEQTETVLSHPDPRVEA
jgi:5-(carboxyamino)imidazole ribonucleotide mutase|tara:strand:- start:1494 stop:1988 length:495 start_codon:yes stop_codon:yes gene_type:complete